MHKKLPRPFALILGSLCVLVAGAGQPDDTPVAPAPRPVPVSRAQIARDLETQLAGRPADEVRAFLDRLAVEWAAKKGAYEVAHKRYVAQADEAAKLRERLAADKPPVASIPLVLKPADVGRAVEAIQQLDKYHTEKAKLTESLRASLAGQAARGAEFDRAASAADHHLFVMRTAAGIAAKAGVKAPEAFDAKQIATAETTLKALVGEVQAGTNAAKAELPSVDRALAVAREESAAASARLTELNREKDALQAGFAAEERARTLNPAQLTDEFTRLQKLLAEKTAALKGDEADFAQALAVVVEARARLAALKDPFTRAPDAAGDGYDRRLLQQWLQFDRLIDSPWPPATDAKNGTKPEPTAPDLSPLDAAARNLAAFQQQLTARLRFGDERAERVAALIAAIDALEQKATAYAGTLADARRAARELAAIAAEIERRVGRGDVPAEKVPEGVAAAGAADRSPLDEAAASVQATLARVAAERDALRKPDPEADTLAALTAQLLALVTERAELLAELKRLAADFAVARQGRPEAEQRRLDQRAAERMARDAAPWEWAFAFDPTRPGAGEKELLAAYYRELIDLDEQNENLKKQRETVAQLLANIQKEADTIVKLRPVLARRVSALEADRDREAVLTRAAVRPRDADRLLAEYEAKTGQSLAKPAPVGDAPIKVAELAAALLDRHLALDALHRWDALLAARLTPTGLKAEAGVYQDERARLTAAGAAVARRTLALTGNEPSPDRPGEQSKQPANGGEIGKARGDLNAARARAWRTTGIKIGLVLLVALILPWFVVFVLRRGMRGGTDAAGNQSPVLSVLRRVLKLAAWIAAVALILHILGFDVTALVVALAIGGLAVALAARPMIADVLGSLVIFTERRFKVGDVIRLGGADPARVVGITWRSTALKGSTGLVSSVPNRRVTEQTVENLSREADTYDSVAVTVSTDKDAGKVINVIRAAIAQCKNLTPDSGVTVMKFNQKGSVKVVEYRFWWFLKDFEQRNKTRDEVFARIAIGLSHEDMTGIEVSLA